MVELEFHYVVRLVAPSSKILSTLPSILSWLTPQANFSYGRKLATNSPWGHQLFVSL